MKITIISARWLVVALAMTAAASSEAAAKSGVFFPETFTLANGMQVVVAQNHRAPVVTHMVWYKVGSADEPPGKSGLAHLLEHLMFKGTKKMAPGEFSKILARHGGQENAFTALDYTAYFQNVAVDRLQMVMEMEADRMANLVIAAKDVETERKVVLEERLLRTGNDPQETLNEHASAALYLNHPYRRPIIGWEHEIASLELDDVMPFYRRWYAPNNAILVIAGDVTAEQVRPLAEATYGQIPAAAPQSRRRPSEPTHAAAMQVTMRDQRVSQPVWSRTYLAPSHMEGKTKHAYPLEVLAEILGGGATMRLYKSLVVDSKLAVYAGAHYSPDDMGPAGFSFYASPRPGVSMTDVEAAVEKEIAKVLDAGVTDEETARAKQRMRSQAVFARDSLQAGARILGAALSVGRTVEDVESWPDRINAVTPAQIKAAAAEVFKDEQSVTSQLLPGKETKTAPFKDAPAKGGAKP